MNLSEALKWRYAAKHMNGEIIPANKLQHILEAIRMAPTSSGLQPFEVLVISSKELKEKIKPIANHQSQVIQASHLLVFAVWDQYTEERINHFYKYNNALRNLEDAITDMSRTRLIKYFSSLSVAEQQEHAARQASIALGFGLVAAALENIDSTPMEGFDPLQLDALLGLPEKHLKSISILALGYRDEKSDWLAGMKKVRRPKEELFSFLN